MEIWRVEKTPLHHGDHPVHNTRADLSATPQLVGDGSHKWVTVPRRQRRAGRHDLIERRII